MLPLFTSCAHYLLAKQHVDSIHHTPLEFDGLVQLLQYKLPAVVDAFCMLLMHFHMRPSRLVSCEHERCESTQYNTSFAVAAAAVAVAAVTATATVNTELGAAAVVLMMCCYCCCY
jgi:hypothetical protein